MRKISEMYKQSGGTCWEHTCRDCSHLCRMEGTKKERYHCTKHPEDDAIWDPGFIACKFLQINGTQTDKLKTKSVKKIKAEKQKKETEFVQMSLFDFIA